MNDFLEAKAASNVIYDKDSYYFSKGHPIGRLGAESFPHIILATEQGTVSPLSLVPLLAESLLPC